MRRTIVCALALAALAVGAPAALGHQDGNPHYRSVVHSITPATPGLSVSVLDYDDRLLLHNTTGKNILILDYKNKPYAKVDASGLVQVNTNSEAYYLNEDRYGTATVPKGLGATPKWKTLSRSGRFDWHDHRMHWMGNNTPPQVTDKNKRTFIFNWKVPIQVSGQSGTIAGTLTYVPLKSAPLPITAIFAFAALLIVLSLAVFFIRRRRGLDDEPSGATADGTVEAW